MVRIVADRRMNTRRLEEIGRDISRSQDRKECDANKSGLNRELAVNPTPAMPLKPHLPHLYV